MSKEKLEKDYQNFNLQIEKLAEAEINTIREKAAAIRTEASKSGESLELSVNHSENKAASKKA
jgi:hypothetical protein